MICPTCKGKGWNRNWGMVAAGTVMGWFWMALDGKDRPQDATCITKDICRHCDGDGFIRQKP